MSVFLGCKSSKISALSREGNRVRPSPMQRSKSRCLQISILCPCVGSKEGENSSTLCPLQLGRVVFRHISNEDFLASSVFTGKETSKEGKEEDEALTQFCRHVFTPFGLTVFVLPLFLQSDTFLWKAPSALIANSQRFVDKLKVSATLDNRRL